MYELTTNEIEITSRDIAELTGKQHSHVMRDIRNEIKALEDASDFGVIFKSSIYKDAYGREKPEYTFGREGAMQLALKYDAFTRRKVIRKLEELEAAMKPKGEELIFLAVIEAKRLIEEKNQLIENMKPKVEFADAIIENEDCISVFDMAKVLSQEGYKIGGIRFFEWLRSNNYVIKRKGDDYNLPTQRSMEMKIFRIAEHSYKLPNGENMISKKTTVTGKGQKYFIEKFRKEGIDRVI